MRAAVGTCILLLAWSAGASAADAAMEPLTVCELLKDPAAHEGKPILLLGRFSFRKAGRFLREEACGAPAGAGEKARPAVLWITDDEKSAPKLPPVLQIDAKAVEQKLERLKRSTPLGHFRFGSSDYDRWAAVYGQLEKRSQPTVTSAAAKTGEAEPATPRLLIRGDAAVIFLGED